MKSPESRKEKQRSACLPAFLSLFSYRSLLLALVLSRALAFCSSNEADNDLWERLLLGRDILTSSDLRGASDNGLIPPVLYTNTYSFTAPSQPAVIHEWLADVIFFTIHQGGGNPGLLLFKLSLALLTVYLILVLCQLQTPNPWCAALPTLLAIPLLSPGYLTRPQIFTYLFTTLYFYILYQFSEKRKNSLFLLSLVMVIWANVHGGFLVGLGLIAVFTTSTIFRFLCGEKAGHKDLGPLFLWAGLSALATLLTPYGIKLWEFLFHSLTTPRPISEWFPVPLFDSSFLYVKVMAILLGLALLLSPRQTRRTWEIMLVGCAVYFSFRHQRHTPFLAILGAPLLAKGLGSLWVEVSGRVKNNPGSPGFHFLLKTVMVVMALFHLLTTGAAYLRAHGQLMVTADFPVAAVAFIKNNHIRGNLVVPFDWGSYALWHLFPQCRVSIDGRYDTAYPPQVIQDNWQFTWGGPRWRNLIEKYPSEIALLMRRSGTHLRLFQDSEWQYIYSDPVALIFVRKVSAQKVVLEKLRANRLDRSHPTVDYYFP
jgi:hypothetical protein